MTTKEENTITGPTENHLRPIDYLLLSVFCISLFGCSLTGVRVLTMHEAVLPQTTIEMRNSGDWLVPKVGGQPWLERPPLPNWISAAVVSAVGTSDQEWVFRIPSIFMATLVVFLVAWMAACWFGRAIGLMSGLILATMFEFFYYACLAEPDIFLCAIVTASIAVFVYLEFRRPQRPGEKTHFMGMRPFPVLGFFFLLGLTNTAKGHLFGTVMVLAPIIGYLLWNRDIRTIRRYVWFWGWLVFVLTAAAWPVLIYMRYPDVVDFWLIYYAGRTVGAFSFINEPWWYYFMVLPGLTAPWTPLAFFGFFLAARKAFRKIYGPDRFLLCWAILPLAVFSIPMGKHHHYLLQCLAPWSVLGAKGLLRTASFVFSRRPWRLSVAVAVPVLLVVVILGGMWVFRGEAVGPSWLPPAIFLGFLACAATLSWAIFNCHGRLAMAAFLVGLAGAYAGGYLVYASKSDQCTEDTIFLQEAGSLVPSEKSVFVDADIGSMDVYRMLFYLGDRAAYLHNLTYLLDDGLHGQEHYVITRRYKLAEIAKYGQVEEILSSHRTRRERSPADRFTLFRLRFHPSLTRYPPPLKMSPLQAIHMEDGPYLGR